MFLVAGKEGKDFLTDQRYQCICSGMVSPLKYTPSQIQQHLSRDNHHY